MLLIAKLENHGPHRHDTLELLNELVRAKAEPDIVASHLPPVKEVTSQILLTAQRFWDENTIGATEWATADEVTKIVLQESVKFAKVATWKLLKRDERGVVVGYYTVGNQGELRG